MSQKPKKLSRKKLISLIFTIFFSALLLFSSLKLLLWKLDSEKTNSEISHLQDSTEISESEDDENTESVLPEEIPAPEDIYWKYLNTPLLSVNLNDLKAENPDTVGWLRVEGTNINYPFVKTYDNKFYLSHSFSRTGNSAGWVFLDYRNSPDFSDQNSIIYAHGRTDETMFGSLKNLLSASWRENPENYLIRLVTDSTSNIYQIFSVYVIPTTSDYLKTSFYSPENFRIFAEMLKNRSEFDFQTTVSETDKILTLSTCYDDYKKIVVHGKLIKYSLK